jgi:hypothetical protein
MTMKKLLTLLIISLVSSCSVQRYSESYSLADFRPYTAEGFLISPFTSYASPYKSVGIISIEVIPGKDGSSPGEVNVEVNGQRQGDLYAPIPSVPGQWRNPSPQETLDKLVAYAKSLGANGLLDCNLEIFFVKSSMGNDIRCHRWRGFAVEL